MATYQVQMSAAGTSTSIPIDLKNFNYGVGILVNIPSTCVCVVNVEVTGDDPAKYPSITNIYNTHDILQALTTSTNSSLAYPVTKVRLNVTSYTGPGSITLSVIQAGGNQ